MPTARDYYVPDPGSGDSSWHDGQAGDHTGTGTLSDDMVLLKAGKPMPLGTGDLR